MQNGIHQLNVSYDSLQDRIRFCFSTQDDREFRFWFTRRYLGLLMKTLGDIAAKYAGTATTDITARQAYSEFAHMHALNNADMQKPYEGGTQFPLGEEPLLVSKIVVKNDSAGNVTIGLMPENGAGADLGLTEPLTHLIADLLTRAMIQAEWNMELAPLVPALVETSGATRLH